MLSSRISVGVISLFLCALPGCSSLKQEYPSKVHYLLEVERSSTPGETMEAPTAGTESIVEVGQLGVAAPFQSHELVYRLAPNQFEGDYYNLFLIDPATLLSDMIGDWISRSGLFAGVLLPGTRLNPTHRIEGSIDKLYGDYSQSGTPLAVIEIRLFLLADEGRAASVLFQEQYEARVRLREIDASGLVVAYNEGMEQILTAFEADVRRVLTAQADRSSEPGDAIID